MVELSSFHNCGNEKCLTIGPLNASKFLGNAKVLEVEPLDLVEIADKTTQFGINIDDTEITTRDFQSVMRKNELLTTELENLKAIQKEYKDMKSGTCVSRSSYEKLKTEYEIQHKRTKELEMERLLFIKEIQECEAYIAWKEDEIVRLNFHIESLTADLDKKEAQLQSRSVSDNSNIYQKRINELENEILVKENERHIFSEQLTAEKNKNENIQEALRNLAEKYFELVNKNKVSDHNSKVKELEDLISIRNKKIDELEKDRELLSQELKDCEDYITNQVNEMKKLSSYIDYLTQDSQLRQTQRKMKVSAASKPEEMQTVPCTDAGCLSRRVELLEKKVNKYKTKLTKQEENRKTLLAKIEEEKISKAKMEETFMKTAHIYEELVRKNQCCKDLQRECEMYKNQTKELGEMRIKFDKIRNWEHEKQNLINEYECHLQDKDRRIKDLCDEIECMKQNEIQIKNTLQNMEVYVSEWGQNLENAETELEHLTTERGCMCNRIKELEVQIEDYEETIILLDEKNQALIQTLHQERNQKLERDLALEMISENDQHLKEMLQSARQTIKCITQKMEQYDIERLETQKDHQIKICELEAQLVAANATIGKLRGNLDKMKGVMDKNVAQKSLSTQLHEAANNQVNELQEANEDLSRRGQKMAEMYNYLKQVLFEKDKTFEDLRNQLFVLRQQLDNEQQRREKTEEVLADVAASGDSALAELHNVISTQNEEITRLNQEIEELMDNTPKGQMKSQIKQLEEENSSLENEIGKLKTYLNAVLPGLNEMRNEVDKQKKEVENEKKMRMDTMLRVQAKLNERDELSQRVRELTKENQELKKINTKKPPPTVVFMEKDSKGDGSVEYRYLCGVTAEEKDSEDPSDKRKRVEKKVEDPNKKKKEASSTQKSSQIPAQTVKTKPQQVPEQTGKTKPQQSQKQATDPSANAYEETYRNLFQIPPGKTLTTTTNEKNLQEKLEKALKEIEDLKKKLTDVRKEKEKLTEQLQKASDEIKQLKREVENMVTQPAVKVQKETKKEKETKPSVENMVTQPAAKVQKETQKEKEAKPSLPEPSVPTSPGKISRSPSFSKEREKLLEQIQQQKGEIANLLKKIEDPSVSNTLAEEMRNIENENRKLKQEIDGLQNQLKHAEQKIEIQEDPGSVEKIVDALQNEVEYGKKRFLELEERWRNCENNYEKLNVINEELKNQNKELRKEIIEMAPRTSNIQPNQLEEVNKHIHILEEHINDAVDNIKKQLEAMANKVAAPVLDESKVQNVLEEIDNIKKQLLDNVAPKKKVSVVFDPRELEFQLQECETSKQQLEDYVKQLETQIKMMKNDILLKWPSTDEMQKSIPIALRESETKIQTLKKENDDLKQQIKKLRGDGKDFDPEQRFKALGNTLRKESGLLQGVASTTKMSELEDILKEWQREYDREISKLRKQLESVSKRDSLLSTGCPAHENIIKELKTALRASQNQCDQLEKRYARLQDENARISKFLENFENEGQTASVSPEMGEKRIRELVEHVKNLEKKNEALQTQNIKLDLENKSIKNDLERIIGPDYTDFEKELQRLRDLERQLLRSQEKYQSVRKRLMKVEIENRNLKKDYIDTLIAKEKILLQSHEQDKRTRETNKLLKKFQDKTQNLTNRIIKMQVENENLKLQQETHEDKDLDEQLQKYEDHIVALLKKIAELEAEVEQLKWHLGKLDVESDPNIAIDDAQAQQRKKRQSGDVLKMKLIQLEVENEFMKREIDEMKGKEVTPFDTVGQQISKDLQKLNYSDENMHVKAVELEEQNEFLKNELNNKDQETVNQGVLSKQLAELGERAKKLKSSNEQLKIKAVETEVENEYLKKELDRLTELVEMKESETHDKDYERASHIWKLKADNLEAENRQLKSELANLVKERLLLETHTEHKLLNEMERLIREYESNIDETSSGVKGKEGIAERMKKWREHYDPLLDQLKKDLNRLTSKDKSDSSRLEQQLLECKATVEKLELDNQNFKVALEVLLKEKPSLTHISIVKEVEHLLEKYQEEQKIKNANMVDRKRLEEVQQQLEECQATNKLLRNEMVTLESHYQEKKIRQLEAELKKYGVSGLPAENTKPVMKAPSSFHELRSQKLEEVIEELKARQSDLAEKLENSRTENTILKTNLQEQKKMTDNLNTEADKYRKMYEIQQNLVANLDKQLQECHNQMEEFKDKLPSQKKVSFPDIQEEQKVQELDKEFEELKQKYYALKREYKEMEYRVKELEERLKKCRDINKQLKAHIHKIRSEKDQAENVHSDSSVEKDERDTKTDKSKDAPPKSEKSHEDNKDNLEMEFDELQKMEDQLLERQNSIESMTQQIGILYNENLALRVYMERVKELELRLLESHANNRRMRIDLQRLCGTELVLRYKHNERRIIELGKQLEESCNKNKIIHEELKRLRIDLEWKEEAEKELRNSVTSLKQDNKNMKNEINNLIQERDRLIETNKELQASGDSKTQEILNLNLIIQNLNNQIENFDKTMNEDEINKLKATIDDLKQQNDEMSKQRFVEFKGSLFLTELEKRNEENRRLNSMITDLKAEIEYLKKFQPNEGESEDEHVRILEETLLKYQNNNGNLNKKIKELRAENETLKEKIEKAIQSEAQVTHIRKLEETLRKYQDNNECLKTKIARLSGDSHVVELEELRDQVEKCQVSNDDLKHITIQLDSEIKYMRKEIEEILKREGGENGLHRKETSTTTSELSIPTNTKTKNVESKHQQESQPEHHINKFVQNLKKQYKKDIDLLVKHAQLVISRMAPNLETYNRQPALIGIQQPVAVPVQPPAYTAVPMMWQPQMLPYGQYAPPPPQDEVSAEDKIAKLNCLAEKIQETLDRSKEFLESEILKNTTKTTSDEEEREEKCFNFETCSMTQSQTMNAAPGTSSLGSRYTANVEINKLHRRQEQTRDRICNLQNKINETMKQLNEETQKCHVLTTDTHVLPNDRSKISVQKSNFGQYKVTNIVSKYSSISGPSVPHFHSRSKEQKKEMNKSSQGSSGSQHSSNSPNDRKKFDSVKK